MRAECKRRFLEAEERSGEEELKNEGMRGRDGPWVGEGTERLSADVVVLLESHCGGVCRSSDLRDGGSSPPLFSSPFSISLKTRDTALSLVMQVRK